jgi:hypothetical protein
MTSLAVQLAETVRSFGVASVYGDPVELDGVTIIPVALVKYGFVGGEDGKTDNTAGGGGGGGLTIPIGAYLKTETGEVPTEYRFACCGYSRSLGRWACALSGDSRPQEIVIVNSDSYCGILVTTRESGEPG